MKEILLGIWIVGMVAQVVYAAYYWIAIEEVGPNAPNYLINESGLICMTAPLWPVLFPMWCIGTLLNMAQAKYRGRR